MRDSPASLALCTPVAHGVEADHGSAGLAAGEVDAAAEAELAVDAGERQMSRDLWPFHRPRFDVRQAKTRPCDGLVFMEGFTRLRPAQEVMPGEPLDGGPTI